MCTTFLSVRRESPSPQGKACPLWAQLGPQASSAWISGCDTGIATARRDRCYSLGCTFLILRIGAHYFDGRNLLQREGLGER